MRDYKIQATIIKGIIVHASFSYSRMSKMLKMFDSVRISRKRKR